MHIRNACLASAWVLGSVLAVAAPVRADDGGTDGGSPPINCDPVTLLCSAGQAPQKVESKEELPIGVDTGWFPACTGTPPPTHCGAIQLRMLIRFVPLLSGSPVYSVDMAAASTLIDARWPDTNSFEMSVEKGPATGGTFKVSHGLAVDAVLYLDTPVFTGEIPIDASQLIPLLPNGEFNYAAMGSTKFAPWGFDTTSLAVNGADLTNSQLFAISLQDLGKLPPLDDYLDGSFSLNATTQSDFSYQTTGVSLIGAPGVIGAQDATVSLPGPFEDAIDLVTSSKGAVRYQGDLTVLPHVNITKVGSFGVSLTLPVSVGLHHPYDSGAMTKQFPSVPAHVPLPNVYLPSSTVAFGSLQTGTPSTKKVTVENTGELGALIVDVASSNPAFAAAPNSTVIQPGSGFDLSVTFTPTQPGPVSATITVTTNDPDSPSQSFPVSGQGVGDPVDSGIPDAGPTDGGLDALVDALSDAQGDAVGDALSDSTADGQADGSASDSALADGSNNKDSAVDAQGDGSSNSEASGSAPAASSDDSGCGCTVASTSRGPAGGILALAIALLIRRRRRSQ